MFAAIGIILLVILIGVLLGKIYNASKMGEAYDKALIFIGFVIGLFSWGFYFILLSGSIGQEQTIVGATETFIVASNEYVLLTMFMPIANFLIILIGMLTVVEVLIMFNAFAKRPKGLRGK